MSTSPTAKFGITTPRGIMLTSREFESLRDYSCSIPTDPPIGFKWRKRDPYMIDDPNVKHNFYLAEVGLSHKPGMVAITWTQIILPDGYVPRELRGRKQ